VVFGRVPSHWLATGPAVLALVGALVFLPWVSDRSTSAEPSSLPGTTPPTYIHLAPQFASPDVRVHVDAGGFIAGETVSVGVTDPIGTELTLGTVAANRNGEVLLDVAPSDYATNGDNLVSVVGSSSGYAASTVVTLIG
jgi:hypothetical protein